MASEQEYKHQDNDGSDSESTDDEKRPILTMRSVDHEQEMRVLSNYSTLQASSKWSEQMISSLINKASSIKKLPQNDYNFSKTIIDRKHRVLKQDKRNLLNPKNTAIKACQSIIDCVTKNIQTSGDPLLSDYDEYIKQKKKEISECDHNEQENRDENEVESEIHEESKTATDEEHAILHSDCFQMLHEQMTERFTIQPTQSEQEQTSSPSVFRECCSEKRMKKFLKLSNEVRSRVFGFIDLITDLVLLYSSSQDPQLLFLTATLLISICSPYIISYSSGRYNYRR